MSQIESINPSFKFLRDIAMNKAAYDASGIASPDFHPGILKAGTPFRIITDNLALLIHQARSGALSENNQLVRLNTIRETTRQRIKDISVEKAVPGISKDEEEKLLIEEKLLNQLLELMNDEDLFVNRSFEEWADKFIPKRKAAGSIDLSPEFKEIDELLRQTIVDIENRTINQAEQLNQVRIIISLTESRINEIDDQLLTFDTEKKSLEKQRAANDLVGITDSDLEVRLQKIIDDVDKLNLERQLLEIINNAAHTNDIEAIKAALYDERRTDLLAKRAERAAKKAADKLDAEAAKLKERKNREMSNPAINILVQNGAEYILEIKDPVERYEVINRHLISLAMEKAFGQRDPERGVIPPIGGIAFALTETVDASAIPSQQMTLKQVIEAYDLQVDPEFRGAALIAKDEMLNGYLWMLDLLATDGTRAMGSKTVEQYEEFYSSDARENKWFHPIVWKLLAELADDRFLLPLHIESQNRWVEGSEFGPDNLPIGEQIRIALQQILLRARGFNNVDELEKHEQEIRDDQGLPSDMAIPYSDQYTIIEPSIPSSLRPGFRFGTHSVKQLVTKRLKRSVLPTSSVISDSFARALARRNLVITQLLPEKIRESVERKITEIESRGLSEPNGSSVMGTLNQFLGAKNESLNNEEAKAFNTEFDPSIKKGVAEALSSSAMEAMYPFSTIAMYFAEWMCELGLEADFQDARLKGKKQNFGSPEGVERMQILMNPILAALKYLNGERDEKTGSINESLILMQSFFLTFFDYFVLKNRHGVVRTLKDHITHARSWADIPFDQLPPDATYQWLGHMKHMFALAKRCMNGFSSGNLLELGSLDFKTNQPAKVNGRFAAEVIDTIRKIDTYWMMYDEAGEPINPGVSKEEALKSGQFVRIIVKKPGATNSSGDGDYKELLVRSHLFIQMEPVDLAYWIPDEMKRDKRYNSSALHVADDGVKEMVFTVVPPNGGPIVNPKDLLVKHKFTQVMTMASYEGDVIEKLSPEDYLLLGIIVSAEIREMYRNRNFDGVLVGPLVTGFKKILRVAHKEGWIDSVEKELPHIEGQNLFTKAQFMKLLKLMGVKYTWGELFNSGKTLMGLFQSEK